MAAINLTPAGQDAVPLGSILMLLVSFDRPTSTENYAKGWRSVNVRRGIMEADTIRDAGGAACRGMSVHVREIVSVGLSQPSLPFMSK